MTLLIPRYLIGLVALGFMLIITKCFLIGHRTGQPIRKGCRKFVIRLAFNLTARFLLFFSFWTWTSHEFVQANYEKYLGSDNDEETRGKDSGSKEKPISAVVCNHVGIHEIMALIRSPIFPSFTPKEALKKSWLVGSALISLQSLFMPRVRQGEHQQAAVDAIQERQKLIADEGQEYSPLCLFAEGTTTNGTHLQKFKRGAFISMRPITPCYFKFSDALVSPTYDVIDFTSWMVLLLSSLNFFSSKLCIMPDFIPNETMLSRGRRLM